MSINVIAGRIVDYMFRYMETDEWADADNAHEAAVHSFMNAVERFGIEDAIIAVEDERDRRWLAKYGVEWGADA